MVVGLALSGGGVTACVCTLCLLDALGPLGPDVVVSTVSGGTLGYLLHVNAPRFKNLTYPETGPNATYESLREARANDGEAWFAQIVREIPDGSRASAARSSGKYSARASASVLTPVSKHVHPRSGYGRPL